MSRRSPLRRTARLAVALTFAVACNQLLGNENVEVSKDRSAVGTNDASVIPAPPASSGTPNPPISCDADHAKRCGDICVDDTLPENGCAGATCDPCLLPPHAATPTCGGVAGTCGFTGCAPGYEDCNGDPSDGCEADASLPSHCGALCATCQQGEFCSRQDGEFQCTLECALQSCPDGSCDDHATSPTHCGGCDAKHRCEGIPGGTATCTGGVCGVDCGGLANCGTACVAQDATHCGAGCIDCTLISQNPNNHVESVSCDVLSGSCTIGKCATSYVNTNGSASDGCECDIRTGGIGHCVRGGSSSGSTTN